MISVPHWEYWTWHLTLLFDEVVLFAVWLQMERNEAVSPASLWHPCLHWMSAERGADDDDDDDDEEFFLVPNC